MVDYFIHKPKRKLQYLIGLLLVLAVAAVCFSFSAYISYRVVALLLLLAVSVLAIFFDILPVLAAASLSALVWDFFFIPPRFNFHVDTIEDTILLIMYFVIALINAVLNYKLREVEKSARKKEEKANAVKLYDTLLNSLSHELRTPIATIIAATDNLKEQNGQLSKEHQQQLFTEIEKASLRLNQQVENLLNMSRLESGYLKPRKDWCDVGELVYDLVRKMEEQDWSKHITIHIKQDLPLVKSDKVMLEQILHNLISNARLHNRPHVLIQVYATLHADILHLAVEDNGSGFPEEQMEQVFDKFYRLSSAPQGGTGLGLSIVKGFTEALKGKVHLQNIRTGGCRFTVDIPCETSYPKF